MKTTNNILLVRVPEMEVNRIRELRDFILQSLDKSVLVLPEDASYEVMELPPLGGVEVQTESLEPPTAVGSASSVATVVEAAITNQHQAQAEEKRAIVQRLKDYRSANGRGCLEKASEKTAHRKESRISADTLRDIAADCAPKMGLTEWRKISKALDALEGKSNDPDRA